MKRAKKIAPGASRGAEQITKAGSQLSTPHYIPKFTNCKVSGGKLDLSLSPETLARLTVLCQRTGLEPVLIVDALIRGADPQLIRTMTTLTARFIDSGRSPRFMPLTFIVADDGQEADHG